MRPPNAIDFWRGVALVMIFINHIPGLVFSEFTLRSFAVSDAAELFVFLAGCSLAYVTGPPTDRKPAPRIVATLLTRAFRIWQAQVVVISVAIAILGAAALLLSDPLFLEWHGAGPAFTDTVRSSIGLLLLTYQIGYFNILPLYVVLLLQAPVFLLLAVWRRAAAFLVSAGLYVATLIAGLELPSWPSSDTWFFNPLSWQFVMVLGFLSTDLWRSDERFRRLVRRAWPAGVALVVLGAVIAQAEWKPDPLAVPEPRLLFVFDKAHTSPARIINMLALAIAFQPAFAAMQQTLGLAVRYFCALGRNSLTVFCVLSVLALSAQIIRYLLNPSFVLDFVLIGSGLVVLGLMSWLVEFNESQSRSSR